MSFLAANGTEFLWWATQNLNRKVTWDKPFDNDVAAFTMSMWIKMKYDLTKQDAQYTPISYATFNQKHELTLIFSMNDTLFIVGGQPWYDQHYLHNRSIK